MNTAGTRCSIFCRVIDNFGDAGVCWRLAKQLGAEYQWQVTLYIDEWSLLTKLADPNAASGVKVARWQDISKLDKIPDVVIEAFACELPPNFVKAMANTPTPPVWINLEYLSAEAWVESAHLLASPHSSTGLQKYFYFPGFSGKTGGLLREPDYEIRRAKFRRSELLALLDVAPDANAILISYFAYANSPRRRLIEELSVLPYLTHLLEPGGTGAATFIGNLTIQPIPFLPQTTYDELLWACDINFVRGEDSFVRAQWAGKPFVWNTYPQENDTHLEKLEAFPKSALVTRRS